LTNTFVAWTTPSTLTPNCWTISIWSMENFSPQTTTWMHPSSMDSQVCKNFNRSSHGTVQWTTNKPPKLVCSTHYRSLDPIWIHCNIFRISFVLANVHFWDTLVSELPFPPIPLPYASSCT
jgi:hypothetical protein